ncbi:hypothetical protein HanIR_Chr13g0618701 [Helianthus annuus]|nr:hypothetical protein HanIR_Chr13g0618701 [Helianthus annuus]
MVGSIFPNSFIGIVLKATFLIHFFCMSSFVISDSKSPGAIEFTLIFCFPSSIAITYRIYSTS